MTRSDTKRKRDRAEKRAEKRKRPNEATTEDGAPYNKRARPDNFTALQTAPPPPRAGSSAEQQDRRSSPPVLDEDSDDDNESMSEGELEDEECMEPAPAEPMAADEPARKFKYKPDNDRRRKKPRVHQHYGQASMFPEFDDEDVEIDEGAGIEGMTAMQYLRSVRLEAQKVPSVLAAPKPAPGPDSDDDMYDDMYDTRGYYQDGAYTAAPAIGPELPPEWDLGDEDGVDEDGNPKPRRAIEPQKAYHITLLARYKRFREILQRTPPADIVAALRPDQCIGFPYSSYRNSSIRKEAKKHWLRCFHDQTPHPAQVASMDNYTVLSLLGLITGELKRNQNITTRMSTWIWSLLGKLGDFSTLTSEDVCIVRELAKRAIWVRCGWLDGSAYSDIQKQALELCKPNAGPPSEYRGIAPRAAGMSREEEKVLKRSATAAREAAPASTSPNKKTSPAKKPQSDPAIATKNPANDAAGAGEDVQRSLQEAKAKLLGLVRSSVSPGPLPGAGAGGQDTEMGDGTASMPEGQDAGAGAGAKDVRMGGQMDEQKGGKEDAQMADKEDGEYTSDDSAVPNANTTATLDAIITIAGEVFGQRDLLEFREIWGADENLDG